MTQYQIDSKARRLLMFAAISGFLVVALGAFGAHGLKAVLTENLLRTYNTSVQYHMFHTLVLMCLGPLMVIFAQTELAKKRMLWSGNFFLVGLILFCGSLYLLAVTGFTWLGMVTPFGGVAFLIAWLLLFLALKS